MAVHKGTFPQNVNKLSRYLGITGYSKRKNVFGLNPLVVSTLIIIATLILASLARRYIKKYFTDNETILKQLALEFVATLELCAACFELIIVTDNWGVSAYALYLFLLTIWWSTNWEESTACPYNPLEDVIEGFKDIKMACLIVLSQVSAALVTFRYVQTIWALELTETHKGKAFEDCTADLQVDMISGAIIEGTATCICRIVSRLLSETDAKFASVLDAFFGTMMVVLAFNLSGGYFNPALATSLKLDCEGNTFLEHVVVYWLGAGLGSLLSVYIFKTTLVQNIVQKIKPKTE